MSEKLSLIIEATDNASSVLGGIGKTLGNLGRVAGGLALGGIAALGAGVVKFASDGLSLNNSMEKVTAQLNAFTKDGAKTASIIDTVRERAAKTPFEFDAMAKAAVALFPASKTAAGGLNAILEKAEILAASNPAEGLEGAAFALKEAVSGDFTSIIERFNLPRQYINDLKKEGVPNLEIVRRAMKEMGLDVDLVSNLANTAEGRWSTFKDTIAGVAATATKPIFDAMSTGIAGVNGLLEANTPLLNQVGATIAGVLTQGIAGLSAILPQIVAGFSGIGQAVTIFSSIAQQALSSEQFIKFSEEIYKAFDLAKGQFATIGTQIETAMIGIAPILSGILESVSSIFGSLIPIALNAGMGAWTMISTTIQTVITSAISIIQTWLPVVQTVLAGIAAFLAQHGAEIQLLVSTAWNAITTIIQTAIDTVAVVINALAPVVLAIFGQISTFLNAHGSEILGFLTTSWNSISTIVSGVAAIIQKVVTTVFGAVASFINNHSDEIQTALTGAWNFIKTIISGALFIIEGLVSATLAIINGDWATGWKIIESVTKVSNSLIQTVIDTAMGLIKNVISIAVDNFKTSWENGWKLIQDATTYAMAYVSDGIDRGIYKAKLAIAEGVNGFIAKFNELKDKMSTIGQQLLEGMVQGIRDKVGWLVDEGVRAANAVLSAIKNTLGIRSPSKVMAEMGKYLDEGLALGIEDSVDLPVDAGQVMADRTIARVRVALEPLPQIVAPIMAQTASTMVNAWSGLNDDLEDQILGAAESIVELAESGDSASLVFAKSFEVLRQTITGIVPSFNDSKSAITRMHETLAAGKFDVQAYWKIYEEMMHGIGRTTSETMPVVARTTTEAIDKMGLSARWFAESFEDQILTASESFVELAQTGDVTSLNFAQAFDAIKRKLFELVPAFTGGQDAMQAMHDAMAGGQFDVEAYWKAYDTLMREIKTSMEISQNVVTTTMQTMADTVVSTTQTMQQQASSAAQSIAASMIAAGEVINTTQAQLASFIQSGGIGGITGGTYTPSQAFQDSFRNPPAVAAPRPSSVPKPTVTNNTPITITINGNADRRSVEDGVMQAIRRSGLDGRYA